MQAQGARFIFSYAYRPLYQTAPGCSFSVNLADNGLLEYATYNEQRQCTGVWRYMLPMEAVARYTRMVDYARPWLRHVPDLTTHSESAVSEYTFVFPGRGLFRIEDMVNLLTSCPFRSLRGHYTRLVYCLFEDIASMLSVYQVELLPNQFSCSLQPLPMMPPAAQQPMNWSMPMASSGWG